MVNFFQEPGVLSLEEGAGTCKVQSGLPRWLLHAPQLCSTVQRLLSSVQCLPKVMTIILHSFCSSNKRKQKERRRGYLKEAGQRKKEVSLATFLWSSIFSEFYKQGATKWWFFLAQSSVWWSDHDHQIMPIVAGTYTGYYFADKQHTCTGKILQMSHTMAELKKLLVSRYMPMEFLAFSERSLHHFLRIFRFTGHVEL